jgi:hypothetical protein
MATTSKVAPIMIRAKITQDEWTQLRHIALSERRAVADLTADALRATYNLKGPVKQ